MWTLNVASGDLCFCGNNVGRLNQSETLVLSCLISNHDLLVSKHMLLDIGWPGRFVAPNSLTTAIKNIRQLLSTVESELFIETAHRKGYILKGNPQQISLIEIVASAQIRLSEKSVQETPSICELAHCDDDMNITVMTEHQVAKNRWLFFKSASKQCLYLLSGIIIVIFMLVTLALVFFITFKPSELYCYQINKAEFCGLFELKPTEMQELIKSYVETEFKYYYGYDESLDEIEVYPAD